MQEAETRDLQCCSCVQFGAAGCVKVVVTYFLEDPHACLASMAAAIQGVNRVGEASFCHNEGMHEFIQK